MELLGVVTVAVVALAITGVLVGLVIVAIRRRGMSVTRPPETNDPAEAVDPGEAFHRADRRVSWMHIGGGGGAG